MVETMKELTLKRFEYMNLLTNYVFKKKEQEVKESMEKIRSLDQLASVHFNLYWSDVELEYVEP